MSLDRRLAAYLPSVLRSGALQNREPGTRHDVAATVLSVDVIGFTSLTARLSADGAAGAERVQGRLNATLGPVVRAAVGNGGDVLAFSGDAVLVLFPSDDRDPEPGVQRARHAVATLGARANGLPMRFGIADGTVTLAVVGDPITRCQLIAQGSAVRRALNAQSTATAGSLVVAVDDRTRGDPAARRADPPRSATVLRRPPTADATSFLPHTVVERIRAGRAQLLPEHRRVTTAFVAADAALAEPESLPDLQRWVLAALPVLGRAGGELRQIECGDKGPLLLAVFGAVRSHPDDEVRAVRACLELLRLPGSRAAGVATGETFCGVLGTSARRDWVVVGSSVNLAARLMAAAPPGRLLVDAETDRQLPPGARHTPVGSLDLAGFGALTPSAVQALPAAPVPVRASFHGREEQLAQLRDLRDAGRPVLVTAPPGGGKSSTTALALLGPAGYEVRFDGVADLPCWAPTVIRLLGLDDPRPGIRAVSAALAGRGILDAAIRVPLLAPVLGCRISDSPLTSGLDATTRTTLLARLLCDLLAADETALLRIEDLHNAGGGGRALVRAVLDAGGAGPAWIVLTSRTADGWNDGRCVHVDLPPLSPAATRTLIDDRLPTASRALSSRIARVVAGNPLYVEQLAAHVSRGGAPDDLPRGLERVVAARIDQLPDAERDVVKVASVLRGRLRAEEICATLPALGSPDDVVDLLEGLATRDLLQRGRSGYDFSHEIIRDVVYRGISQRVREDLHLATGRRLAAIPQTVTDIETVAFHAGRSRDLTFQRVWFHRAATATRESWALDAARDWTARLLPRTRGDARTKAQLAGAELALLTGDPPAAETGFRSALRRSRAGSAERAAALHGIGELGLRTSTIDVAAEHFARAASLAEELGDDRQRWKSLERLAFARHRAGDFAAATRTGTEALDTATRIRDTGAVAEAQDALGLAWWSAGDLDLAGEHLDESIRLARSSGNLRCLVHASSDLAGLRVEQGRLAAATELLAEAERVARRVGYTLVLLDLMSNQAELHRRSGRFDLAYETLLAVLDGALDRDDLAAAGMAAGNLGLVAADTGRPGEAIVLLGLGVEVSSLVGNDSVTAEFDELRHTLGTQPEPSQLPEQVRRLKAGLALRGREISAARPAR